MIMNDFLTGGIVVLCGVASLLFWNFHYQTGERLFGLFALAFATLGVGFLFQAFGDQQSESLPHIFLIRLAAFLLIIAAIVEKNRHSGERR